MFYRETRVQFNHLLSKPQAGAIFDFISVKIPYLNAFEKIFVMTAYRFSN